jgi:receptor protein-tyrosine kinase
MEDTPNNGGNPPGRRARSSLVERAAEKMVAGRGRAQKEAAEPSPAAGAPATAQPLPQEAPLDEVLVRDEPADADRKAKPAQTVDEALPLAALAGADGTVEEAAAPEQRRRRSKMVKIETAGLAARGILTPETKRNRTLEEFRLIKRMVLSRRWDVRDAPGNTVIVTSALPAEGKTTTAINLAMSIAAEEDLRVLLIDADFIKPDALRQLGVSAGKGLIDVLQDPRMDISDVMLRTNIDKLSLIPSGQLHDRCTELLASARMDRLIKELASRYEDRILIFDSPPVLATTESVVLTSHMGQVVFVVQAGRTKRESVDSALELIGDRPHLGLVLNRAVGGFGKVDFGAYYGSYYYGYREQTAE